MKKGIIVEMPRKLYISYDVKRTLENEFYFLLYKEYRAAKKRAKEILLSPKVTIRGFEQLIKVPKETPEEQEAQLKAAARQFLDNLSLEPSWTADYTYDRETQKLDIVLICTEEDLPEDFKVKLFTNNFLCHSTNTHEPIVLTIHTEGFAQLFGEEDYVDYQVSLQAVYAPCITEFKIRCGEGDYDGQLYVNPKYDNPVTLHWKLEGNGRLEHTLQKGSRYLPEAAAVEQMEDRVTSSVIYTLRVENQKGFFDTKQIEVLLTGWHKIGSVKGLTSTRREEEAEADQTAAGEGREWKTDQPMLQEVANLAGLVKYKDSYYAYRHPVLYQSADGCQWSKYSENTEGKEQSYSVVNCGLFENEFYVMAGTVGGRLKVFTYYFLEKTWKNTFAHQYCRSENAHLAFSQEYHYYGQTQNTGMLVTGYKKESTSKQWNECIFSITTDQAACYSDLCFWRDRFYAAILCEDKRFYVYVCRTEMEDALFSCDVLEIAPIRLLPTTNRLFILVNGRIFDLERQKEIEEYVPSDQDALCLGSEKQGLFGIFPDGNFWIYQ